MVSSEKKTGIFMGCGAVLVVLGAVMVVFWPILFLSQLQNMMILTEESMSFEMWRETPIPMYLEFHMFNITNVEDILARKNVTLRVEELGPYVFKETHIKTNMTWNDANSTITYYNQRYWHYQPQMSNGSLSDMVTSINPIIATVSYIMRNQRTIFKVPVDVFMRMFHDNMFLTANITDWLFEGIDDPVLDIAGRFPDLPFNIPYDKFGWFYERNGSTEFDGSFNMHTGASDFSRLGNTEMWQYVNRTQYRGECGVVKGSTGELWAPELGQPELYVFASDICSYLTLNKDREVTVEGVTGMQYSANNSTFDNGWKYPHMACYCAEEDREAECLRPGALNVSDCRFGAPAFVSLPHFLHADPHYPSKVDGLNPTEDMNFRLALEMFTGMPLTVSAQLQINLLIRHVTGITINNQLPDPDTLVPMFWFRQEVAVTREYARLALSALRLRYWVPYGLYALTAIGIVLLMAGIVIFMRKLLRSSDTTPILSSSPSQESVASTQ